MNNSQTGYGRPPVDHQFKAGESGNPSGRPKGRSNFKADLHAELGEICSVSDGAKLVEVSKQRAVVKTLVRKAVAGDLRAIATIVGACAALFDDEDAGEAPEDRAILQATAIVSPKWQAPTPPREGQR